MPEKPSIARLNSYHPLAKGCVGLWVPSASQLGQLQVVDLVRKNDGILASGASWTVHSGGVDAVVTMDGGFDAELDTGLVVLDVAPTQGTIVCLIRPTRAYDENTLGDGVWGQDTGNPTELSFQRYFSDQQLYVGWSGAGEADRVVVAPNAANWVQNEWNLYVFTWIENGTSYLFHQGAQIGSQANCTLQSIASSMRIGGPSAGGSDFSGDYGFFGIWNYQWSAAQIARFGDYRSLWPLVTPVLSVPDASAAGGPARNASGAVTGPAAVAAGALEVDVDAAGGIAGPASTATGVTDVDVAASGAVMGPTAAATGVADVDLDAVGVVAGPVSTAAGIADVDVDSSGAVVGPVAIAAGTAMLIEPRNASGAVIGPASFTSTGLIILKDVVPLRGRFTPSTSRRGAFTSVTALRGRFTGSKALRGEF